MSIRMVAAVSSASVLHEGRRTQLAPSLRAHHGSARRRARNPPLEIEERHTAIRDPPHLAEPAFRVEATGAGGVIVRIETQRVGWPRRSRFLGFFDEPPPHALTLLRRR